MQDYSPSFYSVDQSQ